MTTNFTFAQLALFFATFFYKSQVTVGIGSRAPIIASFIHAIWKEHQNPFYLKLVVKPGVLLHSYPHLLYYHCTKHTHLTNGFELLLHVMCPYFPNSTFFIGWVYIDIVCPKSILEPAKIWNGRGPHPFFIFFIYIKWRL